MSKGFLVFAQNTESVNYLKQAYALALSIKSTQQSVTSISVVTNDIVPEEYKSVFDQIIEIPWSDSSKHSSWKIENRWKLYHVTPYNETMVLDTDMIFLDDISPWWEYCSNSDLKFCSKIKNYKDEVVARDYVHRKAFINNHLPNPYVALHYFKKSDLAYTFYKALEFVVKNWERCYQISAPKNTQRWLSIDLSTAIAIDLLGIEDQVIDQNSPLEFVHMKPAIQGWPTVPSKWQDIIRFDFNNGVATVGNFRQNYLFHYVDKDFLTNEIINKLKESL